MVLEKILLLKSLSIFEETPETILIEVSDILEEIEVSAEKNIFKSGETGNAMYIICNGEIKIHEGENLLATLKENDFFGELSLLDTETRSASATALTDAFLLKLDQEPFFELMESRPEVARGIIKTLCKRLREQNLKSMQK